MSGSIVWTGQRDSSPREVLALRLLALGLAASFFLYMTIYHAPPYWEYTLGHYVGRDLANLFVAARLALAGRLEVLGDPVAYNTWIMQTFGWPHGTLFMDLFIYSYPPHFLPLILPLGMMDYTAALYLWSVLSLVAMATAGWIVSGGRIMSAILGALSAGALANLFHANTGAFAGALMVLGLWYMRRRASLAGVLLGLLSIKPQLAIIPFVFAVLERRWQMLACAMITGCCLLVVTWLMFGSEPFRVFITHTLPTQQAFLHRWAGFSRLIISPFEMFVAWGFSYERAMILHWIIAVVSVVVAWRIWRSELPEGYRMMAATVAAVLVSPYFNHYDLTVLSLGIVAIVSDRRAKVGFAGVHPVLLALLWVAPALSLILNLLTPHLPTLLYIITMVVLAGGSHVALRTGGETSAGTISAVGAIARAKGATNV